MGRTKGRPIVSGRIEPFHALIFGICLGVLATAQLWVTVNALAAALALLGLLGYVLLYTAWLKPRTPQNIVIGGAAGAMPPLVGWAAATGSLTLDALFPFLIIFLWTPPHFWALALLISDDYERTGIPMLPVVRGAELHARPDPPLLAAARRLHARSGRHRAVRRPSTSAPPRCSESPSWSAPRGCCELPRGGPPCSSTWARSPTCSSSSARWRPTGSSRPD